MIITVVACAAALAGAAQTAGPRAFTLLGTVTRVVDGDTVHVAVAGRDEKVRLIGIDTPEVGQCDAAKATALARQLAQGRPVKLVGDPTQATRDRYGRLLAYVVLSGGRDLGYQELARGYRVCIPPPPPDLDCADIPYRNFRVLPPDPHHFDGDHDGIGCEG